MKESNNCCGCACHWAAPTILALTALALLLVQLGVAMGSFGVFVTTWWPAGVLLFALSGFCKCCRGSSCECKK